MSKQIFDRTSSIGTVYTLTEDDDVPTTVIKLPQGVLIRTTFYTGSFNGGASVHTIYLSDDEFFGKRET